MTKEKKVLKVAGEEASIAKTPTIELKDNWEELLQEAIVKINASHIEVNAIKPLINGLIK